MAVSFGKEQTVDDKKDLETHSWSDSTADFAINEDAEYIGGADSKVVKITGIEEPGGDFDYT
eukprot:12668335-Ditylum_brightwellii.AAC.1